MPWSLGQIGDKRAIQPLIAALDSDDPLRVVRVIYALETLHAKEAITRLRTLVNDDRETFPRSPRCQRRRRRLSHSFSDVSGPHCAEPLFDFRWLGVKDGIDNMITAA